MTNPKKLLLTPAEAGFLYAASVLLWLPLYLYDGFVRLIDAKAIFFYVLTILGALLWFLCAFTQGRVPLLVSPGAVRLDAALLALGGLCAVYVLNLLVAPDRSVALWGLEGRRNGSMMLLMCAVGYCVVSSCVPEGQVLLLLRLALTGLCAVGLLGCLNYFLIDPLDVYYILDHDTARIFLSTVGNDNFFGALTAMGAALAAGLCLRAGDGRRALLHGAQTVLLAVSLIPANSDAAWLGFFAAIAVLVCQSGLCWNRLARLLLAGAGFFAAALPFGFGARTLPIRDELGSLSALLTHPAVACAGLLVLLALWVSLRARRAECARVTRRLAAVTLLSVLALMIAANGATRLPLGPLGNLLRFDLTWGGGRGYVWGRLLYVYGDELSTLQKLIGAGGDCVDALLNPHYTDYIIAMNGQTFDSAHNVYVQQLLCGGVLGAGCWLLFWGARLRAGLRRQSPVVPALLAYGVQAFFSIDMPAVLPLAFVLAALAAPPAGSGSSPDAPEISPHSEGEADAGSAIEPSAELSSREAAGTDTGAANGSLTKNPEPNAPRRCVLLVGLPCLFLLGAALTPILLSGT